MKNQTVNPRWLAAQVFMAWIFVGMTTPTLKGAILAYSFALLTAWGVLNEG